MAELYDILKNIQTSPKLLMGGSGGTASVDEDGKIITPSLNVGENQRITANESGVDTTISVKSGGAAGSAAIFLLKSNGDLRGTLFYDESSDKIFFQSASGDMDFQVPAAKFFSFFKSGPDTEKIMRLHVLGTNGGSVDFFISDRDPSGVITGNPGDLVFRADGVNSRQYIHEGASASNDDWAEIATMPPGQTNIHNQSIHDSISFADGSTQDTGSTPDGIGWHPSTVSASLQSATLTNEDTAPLAIFVRADGLKLYMTGNVSQDIFEYDMTIPWDLSTLSFLATKLLFIGAPRGLYFKPDGTKFYVVRFTAQVHEFTMSTPWDVTSVTGQTGLLETSGGIQSMSFKADGTSLYLLDGNNDLVKRYDMSTPWDIDTASEPATSTFDFSNEFTDGTSLTFKPDGRIMYLGDGGPMFEYELTTPWDITTATFIDSTIITGTNGSFILSPDGTKAIGLDRGTDLVHRFDIGLKTSMLLYNNSPSVTKQIDVIVRSGEVGHIDQVTESGTSQISPTPQPPLSITIAWDGKKVFIGDNSAVIRGYDLSTPWDITTASAEVDKIDPVGFSAGSVNISPDGLTLITHQNGAGVVLQFDMTIPWDLSTAVAGVFVTPLGPGSGEIDDTSFSPDGHNFYVFEGITGEIFQYFLSEPFQLSSMNLTSVAIHVLPVNSGTIAGLGFSNDGRILYVKFGTSLYEFALGTQWDISSTDSTFTLRTIGTSVFRGMFVKPDGTRIYHVEFPNPESDLKQFDIGLVTSSLGVGNTPTEGSAIVEINSTIKGFLPPRMTTTQRDAISSPATGLEIHNTTTNQPEFYNGTSWEASHGNETLQETLNHGNITGGSDVELSQGDSLVSESGPSGHPLNILAGIGAAGAGGPVNISAGNGTFQGADVIILGGRTTTSLGNGGRVQVQGGQGVLATRGGDLIFFGGLGGNTSGPGGDIALHAGDGGPPNGNGGDLSLEGGVADGSGTHGNILIAANGARVAIGHTNPNASALVDIISTLLGFLQPRMTTTQRDAIASPAEGLSLYDNVIKRPQYHNGTEWKSVGDSIVAAQTIEIFTSADLDALASGGVITVTSQLAIILKANITTSNRFDVNNGARFTISAGGQGYSLTYDGAAIFITAVDSIIVIETSLTATGGGTLFDISGQIGTIINIDFVLFTGWKMGTIRRSLGALFGPDVFLLHMSCLNWQSTLTLENVSVLTVDEIALIPFAGSGVPFLGLEGDTPGSYIINLVSGSLAAGESLVRIDPGIASASQIIVAGSTLSGTLFDISGGTTGAFTAASDSAIGPQSIGSVSDVGGLAAFNFTPGPAVHIGQEITISGYTTNTAYNGTFIIINSGVGIFEINVPFGSDEATGSFSGDSITLTETATTLNDGDTLVIDTDEATNYDGGATVYNKQTNSFQINRTFTTTHTGTWDTSGLDFRDLRVLANANPGFEDSKKIAFGHLNGHVGNESITDGVYVAVGALGFIQHPSSQRFKHISDSPVWEYTGNEPFDGLLTATIFATKTGSTANYRFSVGINGAVPVFATAIYAPMEVKTSKVGITLLFPLQLVKDDVVRIYKAGDGTSDTMDITDLSISIQ